MTKVQNEMATRISVDTISAITSMRDFKNTVSAVSSAWRAQELVLKSSGQYSEALKAKMSGLSQVIDIQKFKITELRAQQQGLDQANAKQRGQWLNLEKQIGQANRQLAGYESQLNKAKENSAYYTSGLAKLQQQYRLNSDVANSFVSRLRAEGKVAEANRREYASLETSLESLKKQQTKQQFMLTQVKHSSGKASEAYQKQQIQLNRTGEEIAKTNTRMKQLSKEMSTVPVSGLTKLRQHILQVDDAEEKAGKSTLNFKKLLASSVVGGVIVTGLNTITTNFSTIISQGMQIAKVGGAMEARWKNIGVSAKGIKQLSAEVTDLKMNTNLSAQAINGLQTRFYGLTHSVSQTKILTKGVASLTDQLKLSQQQADAFASGLSRVESSGKVTSMSLGRLEKQAPGLTAALSKASGMSQEQFKALVSSGKMTSDQFNQLLAKASKDYDKNAKAFSQSSGGALHKLQEEWKTTEARLAKPLLKVSATGLNELSKSLNNKDVQRGLSGLATTMAKIAVATTKVIGAMAKYSTAVKVAAGATAVLWGYFKTARMITNFSLGISKLVVGIKGITNAEKAATVTQKALNIAMKANTIGLILVAITGLVIALRELYKHNKKFRNFVNGIGKYLKNLEKSFVNTGKGILKGADNLHKQMARGWNNYWRQRQREQAQNEKRQRQYWNNVRKSTAQGWSKVEQSARRGANNIGKWYNDLNKSTSRTIQDMAKRHPKMFENMYRVIQDHTRTWRDLTYGHWDRLFADTKRTANDMNKFHQRLFKDMYDKLNQMTGGRLGDMVKTWQDKMSSISDTVANVKQSIHTHFVDLVRGIIKPFNDMLEDLHKGINWVLDKLGASKIGGSWSVPMPSYAIGTPDTHPGGLAKVNDGKSGHYREMYRLPNGKIGMFPAVRDMIVPLPKGTSVLDGERSYNLMRMMGRIPHYADGIGVLSDMFSNVVNAAGDALDGMMDEMDKIVSHPIEFMESVFKKFVKISTPVKFASDLVTYVPKFIAKQMGAWIKKQFEELANPGGSGVERWRPYVIRALKMNGFEANASQVAAWMRVIQRESNGDPHAINNWDSNARAGHPSKGLVQTIDSTFNANAFPGHHNIFNGFDDLLAGIHYMSQKYGRGPSAFARVSGPEGYANGGIIDTHKMIEIAENNKPEMIVPLDMSKRSRAYQLLGEIMTRFHAEEPSSNNAVTTSQEHQQLQQLNSKFDQLLSMFSQLLGLNSDQLQATKDQGSFNGMKSLYKRMALDRAIRSYSS